MVLRMVRFARPATAGAGLVLNQTLSSRLPSVRLSSWVCTARKKKRLTYCPPGTWYVPLCVAQLTTPSVISPPTIKVLMGTFWPLYSTRSFRALRTLSLASFWAAAVSVLVIASATVTGAISSTIVSAPLRPLWASDQFSVEPGTVSTS